MQYLGLMAALFVLGAGISPVPGTSVAFAAPVSESTEPCRIETTGVTEEGEFEAAQEDVERALAACEAARSRFAELFGDSVPEVSVVLWDNPRYRVGVRGESAIVFWPSSSTMAALAPSPEVARKHVAAQWREVLPHEIAHVLLAVRFFADDTGVSHDGYGTPLPDWLDEAIAIWAEPPASRRERVAYARALPDKWLDLETILSMSHPAANNSAAYTARDGTAAAPDRALWAFYQQSIAVLAFVHDAGGPEAVQELVRRLVADPDDPNALAGLPGLPEDFDGVLAAWSDWVEGEP